MSSVSLPGFVDLQVNGYRGVDFSSADLTEDAFVDACRALLSNGTAAFLPTVITSPPELYARNLPLIAKAMARDEFRGRLPGIHVEGPFLATEARGAHNIDWLRAPEIDLFEKMIAWADGRVKLVTLAAELAGAESLIRFARERGIAVSIGHTMASAAEIDRAAAAGAALLTHLGNGLPNQLHRHENPIWAGLANDALIAMVIPDGHHLPPQVLKSIVRAKGAGRIIAVSDASPIAGLPPGRYTTLGNSVVLEANGRLHNPEKNCLVGSSFTMLECMNHLASTGLLTAAELMNAGVHRPLSAIGLSADILAERAGVSFDTQTYNFSIFR